MSIVTNPIRAAAQPAELYAGDRMSRTEFHRIYERMPDKARFELIGGVVYMASPLKRSHGRRHVGLGMVFALYHAHTPGVEAADNATILLGEVSEPQPDLYLRILPECRGQSRTTADDYVEGAPELLGEIALSSRSIDLHAKKDDYTRCGVIEYIVVCVRERAMRWFDLRNGVEFTADSDGVIRSRVFPGLWLHVDALLSDNFARLEVTLRSGLSSPDHRRFVRRLASRRR